MAAVVIPELTGYALARPRFMDFGLTQTPQSGSGAVSTRLDRLGSRWALDVSLPPTMEGVDLRALLVALLRGRSLGASYSWPQPGLTIGTPGAALVNGAGQTGATLVLDGMTPGYVVAAGQFLSIFSGGRRYLHMAAAAATVTGGGGLTLSILPNLRIAPADNAAVNFTAPVIEGLLVGEFGWDLDAGTHVPLNFSIEESA